MMSLEESTPHPQEALRMLVLRDHARWSGGTQYVRDLLDRLSDEAIASELLVLDFEHPERTVPATDHRASEHLARYAGDPFSWGRLRAALRRNQPDLILLSGPRAMLAGRVMARGMKVPIVILFNNALPEPRHRVWLQRCLAKDMTAGFAVSHATADWAASTYAVRRTDIEVFYNSVDLEPFRSAANTQDATARAELRATLGIPKTAPVVVLSGRVVDHQKGQMGMIGALPQLRQTLRQAHLLVAGDGPDLQACRDLVASLGLEGSVTLAGRRKDMPQLLAASDVAVVPSLVADAFPLTALEAAASGCPVVAFAVGGLPEAIQEGKTGYTVPAGDWTALTAKLALCLGDPAHAARLGAAGQEFSKRFSPEKHAREVADYLRSVIRNAAVRRG